MQLGFELTGSKGFLVDNQERFNELLLYRAGSDCIFTNTLIDWCLGTGSEKIRPNLFSTAHLKSLVIPMRFERMAPRLGIWCSILLSYGTA